MSLSLESAIRSCKVQTGSASSMESARTLDEKLVVCPIWTGYDLVGRKVPYDSFMSKTAGCDTPYSRVIVENSVSRPCYSEYIQSNAAGITGDMYSVNSMVGDSIATGNSIEKQIQQTTGNYGSQWRAQVIAPCTPWAYETAQSQIATALEENRENKIRTYNKMQNKGNSRVNG